jgi:O-antigen/teichoic acid export membrane protein
VEKRNTSKFVLKYFWGNLICSVASLISFPIFTRIFSVSEYGVLALVSSTLTIMFGFSKMGIQNSIVRFYPEFNTGGKEKQSEFFSTYLYSAGIIGLFVFLLFISLVPSLTRKLLSLNDPMPFYAAALFIPAHGVFSVIGNFFRARQEPVLYNIVTILETYLPLLVGLLFILLFGANLVYFFFGGFLGKLFYLSYYSKKFHDDYDVSVHSISKKLIERAFLYGFPLMLLELSANLLAYGDRYIIKYYLDTKEVAIYSVGYNLAMYMANIFVSPINSALQVEYIDIWTKYGKLKTEEYLTSKCKAIMYFGIIFCVIMTLNFKYVIMVFATSRYMESIKIAPYVITSVMIYSLYPVFGAGIYISKTTKNLFYCVLMALIINVCANIILIPRMGIVGAAISTFVANTLAASFIYLIARKIIRINIKILHILLALVAGALTYFLCQKIEFSNVLLNIISKTISPLVLYSIVVIVFDTEYKNYCEQIYNKMRSVF